MKTVTLSMSAAATALLLVAASAVCAMQHEASVNKGKILFNDPKLGTNGKTCNDCHKDGGGLEQAGSRKDIQRTVNSCIQASLKGKALKPDSVEMQSLVLYLKSLGGEKKTSR
jgi:cytochrome c peroxidase